MGGDNQNGTENSTPASTRFDKIAKAMRRRSKLTVGYEDDEQQDCTGDLGNSEPSSPLDRDKTRKEQAEPQSQTQHRSEQPWPKRRGRNVRPQSPPPPPPFPPPPLLHDDYDSEGEEADHQYDNVRKQAATGWSSTLSDFPKFSHDSGDENGHSTTTTMTSGHRPKSTVGYAAAVGSSETRDNNNNVGGSSSEGSGDRGSFSRARSCPVDVDAISPSPSEKQKDWEDHNHEVATEGAKEGGDEDENREERKCESRVKEREQKQHQTLSSEHLSTSSSDAGANPIQSMSWCSRSKSPSKSALDFDKEERRFGRRQSFTGSVTTSSSICRSPAASSGTLTTSGEKEDEEAEEVGLPQLASGRVGESMIHRLRLTVEQGHEENEHRAEGEKEERQEHEDSGHGEDHEPPVSMGTLNTTDTVATTTGVATLATLPSIQPSPSSFSEMSFDPPLPPSEPFPGLMDGNSSGGSGDFAVGAAPATWSPPHDFQALKSSSLDPGGGGMRSPASGRTIATADTGESTPTREEVLSPTTLSSSFSLASDVISSRQMSSSSSSSSASVSASTSSHDIHLPPPVSGRATVTDEEEGNSVQLSSSMSLALLHRPASSGGGGYGVHGLGDRRKNEDVAELYRDLGTFQQPLFPNEKMSSSPPWQPDLGGETKDEGEDDKSSGVECSHSSMTGDNGSVLTHSTLSVDVGMTTYIDRRDKNSGSRGKRMTRMRNIIIAAMVICLLVITGVALSVAVPKMAAIRGQREDRGGGEVLSSEQDKNQKKDKEQPQVEQQKQEEQEGAIQWGRLGDDTVPTASTPSFPLTPSIKDNVSTLVSYNGSNLDSTTFDFFNRDDDGSDVGDKDEHELFFRGNTDNETDFVSTMYPSGSIPEETTIPSVTPTLSTSFVPSTGPSNSITIHPSGKGTTFPSFASSLSPTALSLKPSFRSSQEALSPSGSSSSVFPSAPPTATKISFNPSITPSGSSPTINPTFNPSLEPSSTAPTVIPTIASTSAFPTSSPTSQPSTTPSTMEPTPFPTELQVPLTPVTFYAVGGYPYFAKEQSKVKRDMSHIATEYSTWSGSTSSSLSLPPRFIIHMGDVHKATQANCTESWFHDVAALFQESSGNVPVFFVPGDSDMRDCNPEYFMKYLVSGGDLAADAGDGNNGNNERQRHKNKTHFYEDSVPQWSHALSMLGKGVHRQASPTSRLENFAFHIDNTLFLGLNNAVGSGDDDDVNADAQRSQLRENLIFVTNRIIHAAQSSKKNLDIVIIFTHENPNQPSHHVFTDGLRKLLKEGGTLTEMGLGHVHQILWMHGGGDNGRHQFQCEVDEGRASLSAEEGKLSPNLVRIQVNRNDNYPPLKVTIHRDPNRWINKSGRINSNGAAAAKASSLELSNAMDGRNGEVERVPNDQEELTPFVFDRAKVRRKDICIQYTGHCLCLKVNTNYNPL